MIKTSELRKIQKTSSGTFFVCLPKSWATKHNIQQSQTVVVSETNNGKIIIDSDFNTENTLRSITLRSGPYLGRKILGSYLLGFDVINVEVKDFDVSKIRNMIKQVANRLIGLEIVDEDYSRISLQCLLEPSSFPPEKILRRGYTIASGMHRDVSKALIERDIQLAQNIIDRDEEVNRLHFLLVRILRTIIQNSRLSEKLGVTPIECLDYRLVASFVEAVGDECVQVALKTIKNDNFDFTRNLIEFFYTFNTLCFKSHEIALKAFLSYDIQLAEKVRDMRDEIELTYSKIEKESKTQLLTALPNILSIASALRQIYEHSVDIADLVTSKNF